MTSFIDEVAQIVGVKITNPEDIRPPVPTPKRVKTVFKTFSLTNTAEPVMILANSPNRRRATIQVTGAGPVVFGDSRSAVQKADNGTATWNVAAAGPFVLEGNDEIWAWSTVAGITNCAVIAEFNGE